MRSVTLMMMPHVLMWMLREKCDMDVDAACFQ